MADEPSDKETEIATPLIEAPIETLRPSEETALIPPSEPLSEEPVSPGVEWFREHSIPIAGILMIALLGCLGYHYSSVTIDWSRTKDFSDTLQNFIQVLAFIAGGWWAYFKFIKGRTFKESLTPAVSGKLTTIDKRTYLIVNIRVKNVGHSIIVFAPGASSLKLFGYSTSPPREIVAVADNKLTQFEALHENDKYIEPNEIIDGTRFIAIPDKVELGFRLELEIISAKGFTWRTASVVEKSAVNATIVPGTTTLEGS